MDLHHSLWLCISLHLKLFRGGVHFNHPIYKNSQDHIKEYKTAAPTFGHNNIATYSIGIHTPALLLLWVGSECDVD